METRLSRVCDAIIEAGWLVALIATPLFFNTYSSRVFEPDKLHLLRSIALIMLAAWLIQLIDTGWRRSGEGRPNLWQLIRTTPLVLPVLVLVLAYIISTIFSVVPRISLLGSYVRLQGTFSFLSYVSIFFMVLTHLRTRAQLSRLFNAIILTSVPIALYGMIQHYGFDPLPWGGDVEQRVAANMGNAIFVAAYLIMAFFLTVERLIDSIAAVLNEDHTSDLLRVLTYMFILGIQLITIVFTQSRGPWLGLGAGIYVFVMLGIRLLGRWGETSSHAPRWLGRMVRPAYFFVVGISIVSLAFLIVLNIPNSPLAGLRKERYVGRMGSLLSLTDGTNAVRVLIWEGVVDMMLKPHAPIQYPAGNTDALNPIRPLIGYGPESMWVAYNRFYPTNLAHYEARNASPDRAHNETFDALARTGFLGLAAQLAVFGSIFFYALRWLGLVRTRGRRTLFLILLFGGAFLGVLVPWLADHSLRLAGLGLPTGMIFGLLAYVTIDMLFAGRPAQATDAGPDETSVAANAAETLGGGRRQLVLLAVFAAIVAHFAEIHFGIAIASTLTHFWILAGVIVVVGMGWLREADAPAPAPVPAAAEPERRDAAQRKGALPAQAARPARSRRAEVARAQSTAGRTGTARVSARPAAVSSWREVAPFALIAAVVTLVLVWDYAINQTGTTGALNILWQAFTVRMSSARQPVGSPWLLILLLLTWLIGGILALAEACRLWRPTSGHTFRWGKNAALYGGIVLAVFLIYGLWQSSITQLSSLAGIDIFLHIASYLALFDTMLLVLALVLAAVIGLADCRPWPQRSFGARPALSVSVAVALPLVALIMSFNYNVQIVQADIFYKQGLAYEEAGQWDGAIVLYNKAAQMEPKEDYYYLFLGRALLEFSGAAQNGNATLPVDLSHVATGDLLALAQTSLTNRTREELMRGANAVLVGAQRLNPLNTDHSANLGRLFRTWAFAKAVSPTDAPNNQVLRQTVDTKPDQVDLPKLDQSIAYFKQATSLSPHNAQLWNEQASARYVRGDTQGAVDDLDRSLELDQQFYQTYLLKGDILADSGNKSEALQAYKQAAAMRPNDINVLSAVGVYSAQLGDTDGALNAFKRVIDSESSSLTADQQQLDALNTQATQAGGYNRLPAGADARRQSLQSSIDAHRSQLHVIYRNQALVLRDAGRTAEALTAANQAAALAPEDQKATIQQLIDDLKKRQAG